MDGDRTGAAHAVREDATRLRAMRERSRRIAGVVVRATVVLVLAALTAGALAAFIQGTSGGPSTLWLVLAALQAGVVMLFVLDVMYGTQVYWGMAYLEGLLSRWIEARLRRRSSPPSP